jgi:hypothetical protein
VSLVNGHGAGFVGAGDHRFGGRCNADGGTRGCPPRDSIRTLFPTAKAVGFSERGPITFQPPRFPLWPGRCAGWWAEYRRIEPGGLVKSYVDVSVTLYRTGVVALVALPAGAPCLTILEGTAL